MIQFNTMRLVLSIQCSSLRCLSVFTFGRSYGDHIRWLFSFVPNIQLFSVLPNSSQFIQNTQNKAIFLPHRPALAAFALQIPRALFHPLVNRYCHRGCSHKHKTQHSMHRSLVLENSDLIILNKDNERMSPCR